MSEPSSESLVRGLSSWWARTVIRIMSFRWITWLVLVLGLGSTAVVCWQAWRQQAERRQAAFGEEVEILCKALVERIGLYGQVLQGAGGLFAASKEVDEAEFRAYCESLELEIYYPGIVGLGYIEMVEQSEREEHVEWVAGDRADCWEPFGIWPAVGRRDSMVVRFVEPLAENLAALGYDVGSEPRRRDAAIRSRDSGCLVLTQRIELVQAPGKPGLVLFRPLYDGGPGSGAQQAGGKRFQGWVYAALLVEEMMRGVRDLSRSRLEYEIFDGVEPSPANLLCSSDWSGGGSGHDGLEKASALEVPGQKSWLVRARSPNGVVHGSVEASVGLLGAGGVCMSLLVFGVACSMATTSRRAVVLASGMNEELRRQEEALRASEERLEMVIEGSNDGVWDWDIATDNVYFSPRWKGMLGYQDHELDSTFGTWESLLHPDDHARARGVLKEYFEGETSGYQLEHRLRHADGSYRWILARGVARRDSDGRPLRMAGSHVDLTELKRTEQELRQANDELRCSQERLQGTLVELQASHRDLERAQLELIQVAKLESIGTLAAGVAHEVKNPLQIMVMGLDFLDRRLEVSDEDTRITLNDMRDAACRADAISRELLHFSKATEFTLESGDLNLVLDRSLWLMRSDLTKMRVRVARDLSPGLPPVLIDTQKLQQVFINLINNAIQAIGRPGTLSISTASGRCEELLPPGERWRPPSSGADVVTARLVDSGPGIPEELLPRIFDPFFTTKSVGSGTGLGLSVVKKIIDLHGGLILLRNADPGGLEVLLAFAAAPPAASTPSSGPPPAAGSEPTPANHPQP